MIVPFFCFSYSDELVDTHTKNKSTSSSDDKDYTIICELTKHGNYLLIKFEGHSYYIEMRHADDLCDCGWDDGTTCPLDPKYSIQPNKNQ